MKRRLLVRALGVAAALMPQHAAAQNDAELRGRYLLPVPPERLDLARAPRTPWTVPGMGGNTPTGFGADWGVVYIGGAYQDRTRFSQNKDATGVVGFGLGDSYRLVGLEVGLNTFSTFRSYFFETGGIDLQLSRMLPGTVGLAIGWESAVEWGGGDGGSNKYAVISKWFTLSSDDRRPFSALMLSLGVGNGRFQSEERWLGGLDGVGIFGSAAMRIAAPLSVVADWNGQDLMLLGSIAPFRQIGIVISAGLADIAGTAGDGARFVMGGSLSHDFRRR